MENGTWRRGHGFTILELMVVISIIGILGSIAIPNLARARENAENAKTERELQNIYTAIVMYQGLNGKKPLSLGELVPDYINISNIEAKYELNIG